MKTKSKNSTKRKSEQAKLLKRYGQWCALLKVIAIVITLWLMTGCVTKSENVENIEIVNNCLDTAEYYGDYIECAIQLDEAQR